MVPNEKKMQILEAIARGETFKRAAELVGVAPSSARVAFLKICREIGVPPDASYVRENVGVVLKKLKGVQDTPANKLPRMLRNQLISTLNLKDEEALTPELVSRVVGAKLLHAFGFGPGSLVEVQKWLKAHGYALTTSVPRSSQERRDIEQAVTVLEIYGIKVAHER